MVYLVAEDNQPLPVFRLNQRRLTIALWPSFSRQNMRFSYLLCVALLIMNFQSIHCQLSHLFSRINGRSEVFRDSVSLDLYIWCKYMNITHSNEAEWSLQFFNSAT